MQTRLHEEMLETLTDWVFYNTPVQELLDKYTDQWTDDDSIQTALDKAYKQIRRDHSTMTMKELERAFNNLVGDYPDEM